MEKGPATKNAVYKYVHFSSSFSVFLIFYSSSVFIEFFPFLSCWMHFCLLCTHNRNRFFSHIFFVLFGVWRKYFVHFISFNSFLLFECFFIDDDDWSWNAGCNSFVFVWFCYLFIILLLIWNAINERMKKSQNNIQKQDESPFAHKIYTRAQQNLQLITSWCIYRIGSFYYVSTTAEALFVVIIHKDIYLSIY